MFYVVPEDVPSIDDCPVFAHTICVSRAFGNASLCTAKTGEGLGLRIVFAFTLGAKMTFETPLNHHICHDSFTFFGAQASISKWVKGHIIFVLSLHRQRSISPLGHKSMTSFKAWSRMSTSTFGASLQKQKPKEIRVLSTLIQVFIKKKLSRIAP